MKRRQTKEDLVSIAVRSPCVRDPGRWMPLVADNSLKTDAKTEKSRSSLLRSQRGGRGT